MLKFLTFVLTAGGFILVMWAGNELDKKYPGKNYGIKFIAAVLIPIVLYLKFFSNSDNSCYTEWDGRGSYTVCD